MRNSLCGLYFDNTIVSSVDEFVIEQDDQFIDTGIDSLIEANNVRDGVFGHYWSMPNVCTTSKKHVKTGNKAFRFVLNKSSDSDIKKYGDKSTHSTVMLNRVIEKGGNSYFSSGNEGNKPLDSFIFSVNVLFPASGSEEWKLDELFGELFIQEHHVGYNIPFFSSISLNLNKGCSLINNTIWQESIPKGKTSAENPTTARNKFFARINTDDEEKYLKNIGYGNWSHLPILSKGEWHNFTLYVKLGYTYSQNPRTVLFVDGKKTIDWMTPNAYNCQEFGEYLEFGIYK